MLSNSRENILQQCKIPGMFPLGLNSWLVVYYRPILLITLLKAGGEKGYSLSVGFFCFRRKELRFRLRS
jgi:hypothetical protein